MTDFNYRDGRPCQSCGSTGECDSDCPEAAQFTYIEERINRLGEELAMLPDWFECYDCGREHLMVMSDSWGMKFVYRRPVGLGPIIENLRDPTQTYRLECGHLAI